MLYFMCKCKSFVLLLNICGYINHIFIIYNLQFNCWKYTKNDNILNMDYKCIQVIFNLYIITFVIHPNII